MSVVPVRDAADASPDLKLSKTEARRCQSSQILRCYSFSTGMCGREEHVVVEAVWLKGDAGEITCQRFPVCAVRNYWLLSEWSPSIHNQNHPTRPAFGWSFRFHYISVFLLVCCLVKKKFLTPQMLLLMGFG